MRKKILRRLDSAFVACLFLAILPVGCSKRETAKATTVAAGNPIATATNDTVEIKMRWATGKKYLMRMEAVQSWTPLSPENQQSMRPTLSLTHDY